MPKYLIMMALAAAGCGGGETKAEVPTPVGSEPDDNSVDEGGELIPPEKFDEIKRTFERKQSQISRCFVIGVDAGEIDKTEKGLVTVSTTITQSGKTKDVRIVETSFKSPALEQCVKDYVGRWLFTTLPKELEYSYQYRLERF